MHQTLSRQEIRRHALLFQIYAQEGGEATARHDIPLLGSHCQRLRDLVHRPKKHESARGLPMLVNIDSDKAEEERPSVLHLRAACLAVLQRDALLRR